MIKADMSTAAIWQGRVPMIRCYLLWIALANLVWESAQLPLYTIWAERSIAYNAYAVVFTVRFACQIIIKARRIV